MTLLDTNVLIDFDDPHSPFHKWSRGTVEAAVLGDGAGVNPITIAELVAGGTNAQKLYESLSASRISIATLPDAAAPICGTAYAKYRFARKQSGGGIAPSTPLPDFFIGAHAEALGWSLATRDSQRFKAYFPKVTLIEP
jgi:predicted nucleic acid-binding protein